MLRFFKYLRQKFGYKMLALLTLNAAVFACIKLITLSVFFKPPNFSPPKIGEDSDR
jgi:hypothetical protein